MKVFRLCIVICFALFLLIHVLFTLLYVLPENMVAPSVKARAGRYINPLFDQGWALFAPVPQVNKKVYVSYLQDNKQWSKWEDPFRSYLNKHQSNRFTANGKMVLISSTTLHYLHFENEALLKDKRVVMGDTTSDYYKVLKHEVDQVLTKEYKNHQKERLMVVYTDTDCNNKQAHYIYYP